MMKGPRSRGFVLPTPPRGNSAPAGGTPSTATPVSLVKLNHQPRRHRRRGLDRMGRNRPNPEPALQRAEGPSNKWPPFPPARNCPETTAPLSLSASVARGPRMGRLSSSLFGAWATSGNPPISITIRWVSGPCLFSAPGRLDLHQKRWALGPLQIKRLAGGDHLEIGGQQQQQPNRQRPACLERQRTAASSLAGSIARPPDFFHIVMS